MNTKKSGYIYGIHPLIEAVKNGVAISKVMVKEGAGGENLKELLDLLRQNNIPVSKVPGARLRDWSNVNHQGVVAIAEPVNYVQLSEVIQGAFEKGEDPFIVVLDGITDVRNMGAIARSAFGAGVHALVVPHKGGAAINEVAVKTSAGALLSIPVCREPHTSAAVHFLKKSGVRVLGATEKTQTSLYSEDLKGPLAIVMGGEEKGIAPEVMKLLDGRIRIPISNGLDSLNVSVAAGIVLFEARRQRGFTV